MSYHPLDYASTRIEKSEYLKTAFLIGFDDAARGVDPHCGGYDEEAYIEGYELFQDQGHTLYH